MTQPGEQPLWVLPAPEHAPKGKLLAGLQAGWSVERAAQLTHSGWAQALVTGPLHKKRMHLGGYRFDGHTELLARTCKTREVTMMLANTKLRVALVTTHTSLKSVSAGITRSSLTRAVSQTVTSLQSWWKIPRPKIAVLGLNPHCGEGGLFGSEESRVIEPTIRALQKRLGGSATLTGPHSADTFFAQHLRRPEHDAVVALYHDQGLIPVKMVDFGGTINLTLGLPILRTSVDHGTAFDIVGKGLADPSSFQSALALAIELL